MTSVPQGSIAAEVLDEQVALSIDELCRLCAVDRTYIVALVEEGVLSVRVETAQWHFSGTALRRVRTAVRLQHDLDINLPGVALALQLLEELEALRRPQRAERG